MTRPVYILRWIAVLPGGLLFAILVMFPIHWAVMLIQAFGRDGDGLSLWTWLAKMSPYALEHFGYAFFTPFVWISAAAWIAPKFKYQAGITLSVLWGVGIGFTLTYVMLEYELSGWQWLHLAFTCLLGGAGVVAGLVRAHSLEKRAAEFPVTAVHTQASSCAGSLKE